MKTTRITLIVVSLLLASFTWGAGTSATGGFCPAAVFQNLVNRVPNLQVAIEQKLSAYVRNNLPSIHANTKRPSWVSISDPQERTQQAMADARKAIAKANDTSGDALDQAAAEALTDTLSRERCVLAKTELDVAGSGFGKHSKVRGNANSVLLQANLKSRVDFINGSPPSGRGFDYTELEAGRDLDEVMDMTITGKDSLLQQLESIQNYGPVSELHSIRSLKQRGELVTEIEPFYPGTVGNTAPVDFKTNGFVFQNKVDTATLAREFNSAAKIATVAQNIKAVETVVGAGKFRWCGSSIDSSRLTSEIAALNAELQRIGWRAIGASDFVNLPWD